MEDPPASTTDVSRPWDILPHGLGSISKLFPVTKAVSKATSKIATQESTGLIGTTDPVTTDLLTEPKIEEQLEQSIKLDANESHIESKAPGSGEVNHGVNTSADVLKKVKDLVVDDEKLQKYVKKSKNRYGVDHQNSPFPNHIMPTPQNCEEVHRLLISKHGKVTQPTTIPRPSLDVTGCGEVPDLIDSLLRTLLSAATTSNNSNRAFQSLKDTFGVKNDTADWEAVHKAEVGKVIDSIKCGGLAVVKGSNIKKILDIVHQKNCARRDALLNEKKTGIAANILGLDDLTHEQKDMELARVAQNTLSLDWVLDLKEDWQAMDELVKLPGIGIKTASCVLLFRLQRPSFAVDTHVWRHCKWLGWVPPKATRDQTFNHCNLRIPDELKYPLHQLFIAHGKSCYRCRANTSAGTEEWDSAECPIEHLLNRTEERKQPKTGLSASKVKRAGEKGPPVRKHKAIASMERSGVEVLTTTSLKPTKASMEKKAKGMKQTKSDSGKQEKTKSTQLTDGLGSSSSKGSRAKKRKHIDTEESDSEMTATKAVKSGKTLRKKKPVNMKKPRVVNSKQSGDNTDMDVTGEDLLEENGGSSYEETEDEGSEYHD